MRTRQDPLQRYRVKRDFRATPEPPGARRGRRAALSFVVQKHAARSLHYDFRLELDGSLKSWAVPKGPSLDPTQKRMAVRVEDHPLDYAGFEGTIPEGQYGAGTVIVWDRGRWLPQGDPVASLEAGKLEFLLEGEKLRGAWALVRMKRREGEREAAWLLIKQRDALARPQAQFSVVQALPDSVLGHASTPPKTAGDRPPAARRADAPAKPRAAPTAARTGKTASGALLRVTHGERVIDAASGATKAQLVEYYERAAGVMLPHLRQRPVALLRAPNGVDGAQFFQKHAEPRALRGLTTLDPALDPGRAALLAIDTAAALHNAAQMNVIEIHTWNATVRAIERPDRMVFDLDPGEGVRWAEVRAAARQLHDLLDALGLHCFLKSSGGNGLHVVVRLERHHGWTAVNDFSRAVVEQLATHAAARFVAKSGAKNRVGRIFVDYLRNGRGATTACAFSARARPGLGISLPLAWDELSALKSSRIASNETPLARLEEAAQAWAGYAGARQTLARAVKLLALDPGIAR